MKIYKYKLRNKTLYLIYNTSAMFDIIEEYPDDDMNIVSITDPEKGRKEALMALCKIAGIMAREGELYRRYIGYDSNEIISEEELKHLIMPKDFPALRTAIIQAAVSGMQQEQEDEDEEIDLGLIELNKNKKKG